MMGRRYNLRYENDDENENFFRRIKKLQRDRVTIVPDAMSTSIS